MDMTNYLNEIEYAASQAIAVIWREAEEVARLDSELKKLTAITEREYRDVERMMLNDDDDEGLRTLRYWENYFGPDKERHHKAQHVDEATQRVALHKFSTSAAAGSLLQYAKQGLSLVYHQPAKWPSWPAIGTQEFGAVIRHARNQAMHWETPPFDPKGKLCFEEMAKVDPAFNEYNKRSLGFEVVKALGWHTYDKFKADMLRS